jgi:hypothetical protein
LEQEFTAIFQVPDDVDTLLTRQTGAGELPNTLDSLQNEEHELDQEMATLKQQLEMVCETYRKKREKE